MDYISICFRTTGGGTLHASENSLQIQWNFLFPEQFKVNTHNFCISLNMHFCYLHPLADVPNFLQWSYQRAVCGDTPQLPPAVHWEGWLSSLSQTPPLPFPGVCLWIARAGSINIQTEMLVLISLATLNSISQIIYYYNSQKVFVCLSIFLL